MPEATMPLKFAFLGAWHSHAVMHVREAAARPDEFELVGMYDPDPGVIARNQKSWEQHIQVPVFPSAEAVLESEAVAVIVEGHVYQNLDYTEAALEAGKHVLLEKPAGVDLVQFARLQDLAQQKGLQLHLAYMWRYNAAIRELLRLAGDGVFGQTSSSGVTSPSRLAGTRSWPRSSPPTPAASTSRWPDTW